MRSLLGDGVSRLPLYALSEGSSAASADVDPNAASGADQGGQQADRGTGGEALQDEGRDRRRSVREAVTDAIDQLNKRPDARDRGTDGRFQRRDGETGTEQEGRQAAEGEAEPGEQQDQAGEQPKAAPTAWTKEARAHWEALPPEVQAAVLKRETDVQAGVDKLKTENEQHKRIADVIKPHLGEIQQAGVAPEVGIQRLLDWHAKLRSQPVVRMAELMQVFGLDPFRPLLARRDGQQQDGGQQQQTEQKPAEIPAELKPLLEHLRPTIEASSKPLADQLRAVTDKIAGIETGFSQASQRQTQETVETWGEKKPYFNDVRHIMTEILVGATQTNQAHRYLDAKGRVDLDKLYDAAIYAVPEIRAKVLEEQQAAQDKQRRDEAAARAKTEREAADRARRAGVSLPGGAPGTQQGRQGTSPKKGRSVRESVEAAVAEVRERGGARV